MKKQTLQIFLFAFCCFQLLSCANSSQTKVHRFSGETMGTQYSVIYYHQDQPVNKAQIDSVLVSFNQLFSTYDSESFISSYNRSDSGVSCTNPMFKRLVDVSMLVYAQSEEVFNPAAAPLFNAWGFGEEQSSYPSDSLVKIKQLQSDFKSYYWIKPDLLIKPFPEARLNFNAIAKGYGVDVLSAFLADHNIESYMVEIGGEVKVGNQKPDGNWKLGITTPDPNSQVNEIELMLQLKNKALATSGNYRNFMDKNGQRIGHTINPKTGYPVQSDCASVSILAENCMRADAWATACMVAGSKKCLEWAENYQFDALILLPDSTNPGKWLTLKTLGMDNFTE